MHQNIISLDFVCKIIRLQSFNNILFKTVMEACYSRGEHSYYQYVVIVQDSKVLVVGGVLVLVPLPYYSLWPVFGPFIKT